MSEASHALLLEALATRLATGARAFLERAREEIAAGCDDVRFAGLISLASRHVPAREWAPTEAEMAAAASALPGWSPERWSLREAARVALVLGRADLEQESAVRALEGAFLYADVGEACALYKSLAHLPRGERFAARAAEGARTNIRAIFEATVCDTPYPALHFDAIAWRQCAIKALFVEAPLWRLHGLDARLDPELARMALDLAEERRSAGRHVPPQLWLCLGAHAGERGLSALLRELAGSYPEGRAAAALALGRLDSAQRDRAGIRALLEREEDPLVQTSLLRAQAGNVAQSAFRAFDGPVPKVA